MVGEGGGPVELVAVERLVLWRNMNVVTIDQWIAEK